MNHPNRNLPKTKAARAIARGYVPVELPAGWLAYCPPDLAAAATQLALLASPAEKQLGYPFGIAKPQIPDNLIDRAAEIIDAALDQKCPDRRQKYPWTFDPEGNSRTAGCLRHYFGTLDFALGSPSIGLDCVIVNPEMRLAEQYASDPRAADIEVVVFAGLRVSSPAAMTLQRALLLVAAGIEGVCVAEIRRAYAGEDNCGNDQWTGSAEQGEHVLAAAKRYLARPDR